MNIEQFKIKINKLKFELLAVLVFILILGGGLYYNYLHSRIPDGYFRDGNSLFICNEIDVMFNKETSEAQRQAVVKAITGTVKDSVPEANSISVTIPGKCGVETSSKAVDVIQNMPGVFDATFYNTAEGT